MWLLRPVSPAAVLFIVGSYIGLFVAPAEKHMGDVQRMLYVHVPAPGTHWSASAPPSSSPSPRFGPVARVGTTTRSGRSRLESCSMPSARAWHALGETNLGNLVDLGRCAPHLSFVMLLLFAGVLTLRSFVDDPTRRATWTAIATIVAWVDVPLVYFCVRWWRSLHQIQSTPETVASSMALPMRINAFAVLFLSVWSSPPGPP